jgi:hypothetical protein
MSTPDWAYVSGFWLSDIPTRRASDTIGVIVRSATRKRTGQFPNVGDFVLSVLLVIRGEDQGRR